MSENITFWAGPNKPTGNAVLDALPSENGFYIRPQPIDIQTFTVKESQVLNAKIRHEAIPQNATVAEAEEEEGSGRKKRDLFKNVYEERIPFKISATFNDEKDLEVVKKSESIDNGNNGSKAENNIETTTVSTTTTTTTSSTTPSITLAVAPSTDTDSTALMPLEWYAGFQPLLLTLPEDKWVKTINWVSIYDHNRKVKS